MQFNLTKFKNSLLPVVTLMLLFATYRFGLKNTIEAWQINNELNAQLARSSNLGYSTDYLERKNHNLDRIISLYRTDTLASRNATITNISLVTESDNVNLLEVPIQDALLHSNKYNLQRLVFAGDYFSILRALNHLQQTAHIGMIRSVSIKTAKSNNGDGALNKPLMEIYFESVK